MTEGIVDKHAILIRLDWLLRLIVNWSKLIGTAFLFGVGIRLLALVKLIFLLENIQTFISCGFATFAFLIKRRRMLYKNIDCFRTYDALTHNEVRCLVVVNLVFTLFLFIIIGKKYFMWRNATTTIKTLSTNTFTDSIACLSERLSLWESDLWIFKGISLVYCFLYAVST